MTHYKSGFRKIWEEIHMDVTRVTCNGLEKQIKADKEIQSENNPKAHIVKIVT